MKYRTYTAPLENLKFVSWGSAQLRTLTARDPLGNYKVIVTIDEDEGRRPFLAETGETFQKALEALHNKSADLVHRHIESVGFEYRRRSRKKSPKSLKIVDDSDDGLMSTSSDGSASPTLALSDIESADEAGSDDDDIVSVVSDAREKRASKHSLKSSPPQPGPPKPPASSKSRVDDAESRARRSPSGGPTPPLPPPGALRAAATFPPPPLPPGWRPALSGPPPPPRPSSMAFPPPPAPPVPPPALTVRQLKEQIQQQQPPAGPHAQLWDVRMAIKFIGRGDTHVLASVRPSIQELRKFATDYVMKNPAIFRTSKSQYEQLRPQTMVRRVVLGQVGYDVSTYPKDDLTKLFTAGSAEGTDAQMPLVEVAVWPQPQNCMPPTPANVRSPSSSPTLID